MRKTFVLFSSIMLCACEPSGVMGERGKVRFTGSSEFNGEGFTAERPLAVGGHMKVTAEGHRLELSNAAVLRLDEDILHAIGPGRSALIAVDNRRERLRVPQLVHQIPQGVVDYTWVHTAAMTGVHTLGDCLFHQGSCEARVFYYLGEVVSIAEVRFRPGGSDGVDLQSGEDPLQCSAGEATGAGLKFALSKSGEQAIMNVGCYFLGTHVQVGFAPLPLEQAPEVTLTAENVDGYTLDADEELLRLGCHDSEAVDFPEIIPSLVRLRITASPVSAPLVAMALRWRIDTPELLKPARQDVCSASGLDAFSIEECDDHLACTFQRLGAGIGRVRVNVPGTNLSFTTEVE